MNVCVPPPPKIEKFLDSFVAMRANKQFNQTDSENCWLASYEKTFGEVDQVLPAEDWSISNQCFNKIYFPKNNKFWEKVDFSDVSACINTIMKIVEYYHGPQKWR